MRVQQFFAWRKKDRITQGEQSGDKERGYQQKLGGKTKMHRHSVSHGGENLPLDPADTGAHCAPW